IWPASCSRLLSYGRGRGGWFRAANVAAPRAELAVDVVLVQATAINAIVDATFAAAIPAVEVVGIVIVRIVIRRPLDIGLCQSGWEGHGCS
ncbi:MAG: hypothetical protein V4602_15145, partial [Pseudomonadota bacterium]